MKKVTIITGSHGSGKTTKAIQLIEGKKACWMFPPITNAKMEGLDKFEIVVVEEVANIQVVENLLQKASNTPNFPELVIVLVPGAELMFQSLMNESTTNVITLTGEYAN